MQAHVRVLVNLIDFGLNLQAAGEAARLEHVGSATPTGRAATGGGTVIPEAGIAPAVLAELRRRGHRVGAAAVNGGGGQGIRIDPASGVLQGGSDQRTDGCAEAY